MTSAGRGCNQTGCRSSNVLEQAQKMRRRSGTIWVLAAMLATPAWLYAFSNGTGSENNGRALAEQVGHELMSLPYYSVFDDLSFRVVGGSRVILSGQVTQPVVKEDAERAIRRLPGVESVVDQIEVLPLSRVDDQIRRGVYYAVYGYAPLERYGSGSQPAIRIIVKNGRVTLTGSVANQMDRTLVYQRALSVPGVFSVINQLMVEV
jgi:hyperosmotically inducible periplasmic protein